MVAAHSGALAAGDGGWAALAGAYGVHRVGDLAELADTLELFGAGRRARWPSGGAVHGRRAGIATVHDSGLERAHTADLADAAGVPFAEIGPATTERLAGLLDPGLLPTNPLDVWGTGSDTEGLFTGSLTALAGDPAVAALALAVDLVPELDGDQSYPVAARAAAAATASRCWRECAPACWPCVTCWITPRREPHSPPLRPAPSLHQPLHMITEVFRGWNTGKPP
jgi:acyl-CoA synthetase (NDP forming)